MLSGWRLRGPVLVILLLPVFFILIFAAIYATLPEDSFVRPADQAGNTGQLPFDEAMYLSITTQTLLGSGEVAPKSKSSRAAVAIQSFITLIGLTLAAAYGIQTSPNGAVFY